MSLDTVLKIGKAFRESDNGLKHFRYINPCPKDKEKESIIRLSLPVKKDFSFDFDNLIEITNENIVGSETIDTELYYLTFKTSDKDNNPIKYIFSDIYYGSEKGKEKGWYKTERKTNKKGGVTNNSFFEGNKDDKPFCRNIISKIDKKNSSNILMKFREKFKENIDVIETGILKKYTAKNAFENIKRSHNANKKIKELFGNEYLNIEWNDIKDAPDLIRKLLASEKGRVFLHFDLSLVGGKKYWYQYVEIVKAISKQIKEEMTDEVKLFDNKSAFVFRKELYRNICSGDSQGDKQFPQFDISNRYKSFLFSKEDIENLYFGINSTEKGLYIGKDLVSIIILPNGNNLEAVHYENFQKAISSRANKTLEESEIIIKRDNENVFDFLCLLDDNDTISEITRFDVIFVNKGQNSDSDLIEISNIERSFLNKIFQNIRSIKNEIYEKICKAGSFERSLSIDYSFLQILGNGQEVEDKKIRKVAFKVSPKYKSHLIKVLPQIYCGTYINDNLILSSFVSNVEYSIRHGDSKFKLIKYDLEFILSIQNTKIYKSNYMKIVESESYQIGLLLGKLSRDFAGESSPIKSFEKNYVGNLTRKIPTLKDLIEFKNDVEQKLLMHTKSGYSYQDSAKLTEKVKNFAGIYDKQECAFGFFEGYYERSSKKSLIERIEDVLEKAKSDEANNKLIEQVAITLKNFKINK